MKNILMSVVFIICISCPVLSDEESKTEKLSLEDCVGLAIKNNLDIYSAKIDLQISGQSILKQEGAFDFTFYSSITKKENREFTGYALAGANIIDKQDLLFKTGFKQKVTYGTEYDIFFNTTSSHSNSLYSQINPSWQSYLGISITQPILKGFGQDVNKADITIARFDESISQEKLRRLIDTVILDVWQAYWNLQYNIKLREFRVKSKELSKTLLEVAKAKKAAGVLTEIDVIQAESGLASKEESVIISENDILKSQDSLKNIIKPFQTSHREWDFDVEPIDEIPKFTERKIDLDESINQSLSNRGDYIELKKELEKSDIKIKVAENSKLPSLNLVTSYQLSGLARNLGNSFDRVITDKYNVWEVGFSFEIPIGNTQAKANLKTAELEKEKYLIKLKKLENSIALEVRNIIRDIESAKKRMEATGKALELAKKQFEAEQKKFEQGVSTSYQVLEMEEIYVSEQINELKARIDYIISLAKLDSATSNISKGINIK